MFSTLIDWLMSPVNFVRKTFGWLPEDVSEVSDAEVELQQATIANGGPSASTFAGLRQSAYEDEDSTATQMTANNFAGLSIYVPDIITLEDWQTLSMSEIDAKLVANGEPTIGDPVGDPFYDLNPLEIADLTDDEFQALFDLIDWGDEMPQWEGIITDEDWATLSMAEIDIKMESHGLEPIGDATGDPFYDLTPAEVDALSDAEYAATVGAFGWEDLYFPGWEGVILPSDLDVLSPAELDAKLLAAEFETVGIEGSPFYNLTGEDIQLLPDTALEQLYADEQVVYQSLGYEVASTGTGEEAVSLAGPDEGSGEGEGLAQLDWLVG